ncbi:MAG TPA: glycosyltransferase family 9 protein, partial [Acidobacteriaceae bacterium]|nr:glycosyltransferase family 9 protein [Acidobacteriaceae bacterium]
PEARDSGLNSPEISSEFPQHSGFQNPESAKLFLYAEQGLGDTAQFVRYLPLVASRLPGVPIVLEVQPPVLRLIASSLAPDSGTSLAGLPVQLIASGCAVPEFTHHCPLMSLPAIFATTLATVPAEIPYLRPPTGAPGSKETREPASQRQLSIGVHWAGNPRYRADRERSTTLSIFEPLLSLPGMRWVSLQKGPAARQIDHLPPHLRPLDASSSDVDLADTAATIAGLDLVITTDSAVAHLAGALGKPLWLLLPWQSDWRWMQEIATTPWYPTARLWRQPGPGDWAGLIEQIRQALQQELAGQTAPARAGDAACEAGSLAPGCM